MTARSYSYKVCNWYGQNWTLSHIFGHQWIRQIWHRLPLPKLLVHDFYNFIEFITVSVRLAEQNGIIREEPTYTFDSLVSDIGGALGLILGLSVLDLLIPVSDLIRKVFSFTFRNPKGAHFKSLEEVEYSVSLSYIC